MVAAFYTLIIKAKIKAKPKLLHSWLLSAPKHGDLCYSN